MKNYTINKIGYIGITLTLSIILLFSCKKEENKLPTTSSTTTTTSVVRDTFLLTTSATSPASYSGIAVDTVFRITVDTTVKYTIPLNYSSKYDTMTVSSRYPFFTGTTCYTVDHIIKYNNAYKIEGWITHYSPTTIKIEINQITRFNNSQLAFYNLTYTKL